MPLPIRRNKDEIGLLVMEKIKTRPESRHALRIEPGEDTSVAVMNRDVRHPVRGRDIEVYPKYVSSRNVRL